MNKLVPSIIGFMSGVTNVSRESAKLRNIWQDTNTELQNAKEIFGDVEEVCAGVAGEFAFLTKKMSERSFEEKAAKVTILNRIRTEWCAE